MGASASRHKTHGSKTNFGKGPDRPSPPGRPQLVPGLQESEPDVVTIRWDPPEYDGGAKITGYLVEHKRTGSPHWVRASPTLVRQPELTLSGLEPGWRYQFRVSAKNSYGISEPGELSELLTVTLQRTAASAPNFITELIDVTALENEKAELTVEYRGTPAPTVAWYKDGLEIFSGRRHRIITENGKSTLIIHQAALCDEGEIKCAATNRVGHAVTKATLRTEAPPSIRLPRQYEDGLLFEKDEVMRLKVTVAGRPVPSVSWFHNGEPLVNSGRFEMTFSDLYATLRVDEARRSDRGEYQVRAINQLGEDIASFLVTVTDRPQSPGKAKVVMTLGRSVTLSWSSPEDDGGCKIGNYIVEYYRLGWNMWLKAATCRQLTTTLGDLIEGSEYKFRVKAENPFGVSEPGEESDILFIPDPHRGLLVPPVRRAGFETDETGIEEWLLDPHKRQRETTPRVSPPRDHKKVKKKQEFDRSPNPENSLTHEDNGFTRIKPNLPVEKDFIKEQKDAPQAPKRKLKRKQIELKETDDNNDGVTLQKFRVKDEGKTEKSNNEVDNNGKTSRTQDFHDSSELMLVLLPHSRATTEERESARKEIIDSLKSDSPGIAPPMSLSAPELGSVEPERPMNKQWVSSTELLHERAMARFYQAVAEEEAERSLQRRYSVERRSLSRSRDIPQFLRRKSMTGSQESIQDKAKHRSSMPGETLDENFDYDKTSNQSINELKAQEKICYKLEKRISFEDEDSNKGYFSKKRKLLPQSSEEEESKSFQESIDEEYTEESNFDDEEEEEYTTEADEEDYEIGEEEEYEDEEELEEEEEIEEEEDEYELESADVLGESEGEFDERSQHSVEEETTTYHPRNMTPKSMTFTTITPTPLGIKQKPSTKVADNLRTVTDVATAVVNHSIQMPLKQDTMTNRKLLKPPEIPKSLVRIEVTPPPMDDKVISKNKLQIQQEKHIIKPIIKKLSPSRESSPNNVKFKFDNDTYNDGVDSLKKQYSPPRFTPDGRHLPNMNPPIPKPILKVREQSQERITIEDMKSNNHAKKNTAPIAEVEPELNITTKNQSTDQKTSNETDSVKLKKKQVRIEEPENNKKLFDVDVRDTTVTRAGDVAQTRRRSRVNSLADPSDPTKCVIHHYSDIVREFGRVKKVPTTLYLNYEDLKAAAQKSEDNLFDPILSAEEAQENGTENVFNTDENEKFQIVTEKSTEYKEVDKNIIEDGDYDGECDKELEFLSGSTEIKELPQLILLSQVETKQVCDSGSRKTQGENDLTKIAERRVRYFIDYITDITMFLVACWLYAFSDERLVIPILILMVYRQAKDATVSYFKRQIAKLPKLPRLPWRKKE